MALALAAPALAGSGDAEQERRVAAAKAAALADKLRTGGAEARAAAAGLQALGEPAHPAILAVLPGLRPAEARVALGVLASSPTRAGRDALLRAAASRHVELRRGAAENACMFPGDERVADAIVALLGDEDGESVELAQGALLRGRFPTALPRVLDAIVLELGRETPRDGWMSAYRRTVEETLLRAPERTDLVHAALAACARVDAPDRRADLFLAAARSGHPGLRPLLVALLEEALPGRDPAAEPIELPYELAAGLEALRPLDEAMVAGCLAAVGRAKMAEAFPAVLRGCRDKRFTVRRAALPAAWPCAPDDQARRAAQTALVEGLGSADRGLRTIAHAQLKRIAGRDLPASIDAWLAWLREQDAAAALAVRAREAGYETVEAYLADHPDEAPAPPAPPPAPAEPAGPLPPDPDLQEAR